MALNIQDIKTRLNSFFQQIIKNIISLGDDSTLESDLKPIKVGGKVSPVEISETELKITGTINAEAINVNGSAVQTGTDLGDVGWFGSATRIKFFPHQFVEHESANARNFALVEDDVAGKLGVRVSNTSAIMFSWIAIPTGYTANAVRCYADTGSNLDVQCYSTDIDDGDITDIGNGDASAELDITDVASTTTNSIIVMLTFANTTTEFYGGYISIVKS